MYDAHIHMVLDGENWRASIARHEKSPDEAQIRAVLAGYQARGVTWLRDGGDRWGVCQRAAQLAGAYGLTYRQPAFPIYRRGSYGSFIGRGYDDLREYGALVEQAAHAGADFIKLMLSGIMDFDHYGVITGQPRPAEEIVQMIRIARENGLAVMAHTNGARTVQTAAEAGAASIEHGAYLDEDALRAMAEHQTVWTPTIVTIGNIRGKGRYPDVVLRPLFALHAQTIRRAAELGVPIAIGSDAGAWCVPHDSGAEAEWAYITQLIGADAAVLRRGEALVRERF